MASNLACVGLAISSNEELQELISRVLPLSARVGEQNGIVVRRWQDESGARLVFGLRAGAVVEFLPSLAAVPGAILGPIVTLNDEVSSAAILDDQGEQLTSAAFELEERGLLNETLRAGGPAAVVALGQAVTVHEDAAQFEISRGSLLDPSADLDAPAPPHYAERGLKWPPRMASESFFSNGVFQQGETAEATARLNGVVLRSDRRVNSVTGQAFVVARVRTVGFEVELCLPGAEHVAELRGGQIVAGRVFLTASLAGTQVESQPLAAGAPAKQRWWRRA
jgi:hypothetical protein